MSYYNFKVKDYRIIKEADFSPTKITLVYARNGSGKSTLLKALVSLLSNKHSEVNFRHGKDSYEIVASVGDNKLTYTRTGTLSQLQFNDELPRSKFGQGSMAQAEPRFPLKRFDYLDSSYFPNFSFQNKTPVFDDIAVEDLFASLFSDVSRLSERVTACRNACVNTSKLKNDSQVNSDMLKEKVSEASKNVAKIKEENPNLEEQYTYLKGLVKKRDEQVKFFAEYTEVSAQCPDLNKRRLVSLYKEAQPLFSDLSFTKNMQGVLAQLDKLWKDLVQVKTEVDPLVELFPVDVVSLVDGVRQISTVQASLTSIHVERDALPDISYGLVSSGVTLISLKKTIEGFGLELRELPVVSDTLLSNVWELGNLGNELYQVRLEIQDLNTSYDKVVQELREFPCSRYLDNLCPFQEQIMIGG